MDESRQGSLSQSKTIKAEEIITSKTKLKKSDSSFLKKLLHLITCIVDLFITLFDKIYSLFSDCSLVTQFSILLIPLSILMILIIYNIHVHFYTDIYDFNFSKTYKEEFLDPFMTQIDDLKSELTAIIIKDSKLDFENQLFFQIYFRELASVGFFKKEPNKKFLDDVNKDKYYSLFSQLNYFNNMDANFVLEQESSKRKIDNRDTDQLGELGKIYYYIFPYIWYQSISINSIINQSFFIAYELGGKNYSVDENYFFFRYPRNSEGFKINDNFIRSNNALNPQIFSSHISDLNIKENNNYNFDNWYMMPDYKFRESINFEEDRYYYKLSLAHLNAENDGNINKTFITYSQQYIKCNERYFFINIIFFKNQINLKEGDNDYSSFIVKDNYTKGIDERIGVIYDKHSDNISYVLTLSDITEYSLTETDYKFFHLGLYENNEIYYMNGILFDSFNLDYLYDHSKYYTSTRVGVYDIKYFVTLYLYKSLFQNIRFKEIRKKREEIFLYHFRNKEKVKKVCEKINFASYRDYLRETRIDCWEKRNQFFYDIKNLQYIAMFNDSNRIGPIYPFCSCLPLYCLENYPKLDKDLKNWEISDHINLPNKCQNIFRYFERMKQNDKDNENNNKILKLVAHSVEMINYDYSKFIFLNLDQLPGYFFLIISQIKTFGETSIHTYYRLRTKLEIILIVPGVLIVISILNIIIIYITLKKYSSIINNFKQKYELYVFHSECEAESNSNNNNNLNKYNKAKADKKKEHQIISCENIQFLENESLISKDFNNINDNNLLDDLFSLFSEFYNINRNEIENYYSQKSHKTKNEMKIEMMNEKNELFELLSNFSLHATFFQLNLNFDYNMYEHSEIMKKYNHYIEQLENFDKEQTRLTQNILYELISTENIVDYGLITNFDFQYITNLKSDSKKNSIQYTMFENLMNRQKKFDEVSKEEKDEDKIKVKKLILKRKNILIDLLRNRFESDDFLNHNKLDNAFNFFLVNSYYKYSRQILLENNISEY